MRLGPCEVRLAKKASVAASAAHTTAAERGARDQRDRRAGDGDPVGPGQEPEGIDRTATSHEERGDDAVEQGQDEQEGRALRVGSMSMKPSPMTLAPTARNSGAEVTESSWPCLLKASPPAASVRSPQYSSRAATPSDGSGPVAIHWYSCGTDSTKAMGGSQDHVCQMETMAMPASAAIMYAIVAGSGSAPRMGGAASAATSPKPATIWERVAMAMTVVTADCHEDTRPGRRSGRSVRRARSPRRTRG